MNKKGDFTGILFGLSVPIVIICILIIGFTICSIQEDNMVNNAEQVCKSNGYSNFDRFDNWREWYPMVRCCKILDGQKQCKFINTPED